MTSIAEEMPKEQARVREILGHYKEIGPQGAFGALMIENALKKADRAMASGEVTQMIAAYRTLKEIKE